MATATKSKPRKKTKSKPSAPSLGSQLAKPQAEELKQIKIRWLRHQINEKLNASDDLVTPAARDLGIEMDGSFFAAPVLDLFTKGQLQALAAASGVDVSGGRGATKASMIEELLQRREQLVIPKEIALL